MIELFTDPVLRAPTLGCMLMCIASSLVGVLVFLRKQSLVSESLSHAAYPGACLGVAVFSFLFPSHEEWAFLAVLLGAMSSSALGLAVIHRLEKKRGVRSDTALCFVLAVFFGAGILIASAMQRGMPLWHKQVQMLLFGQAATMQDLHVWIYGALSFGVALFLYFSFYPLKALLFNRDFSVSIGLPVRSLERMLFILLLFSLVVGIRSVGVVLMSSMVIAPAVAARGFSNRLSVICILAAFFGAASGLFGNALSSFAELPTGPAIVLVGTGFAFSSLLFAPKRGLLFRVARILRFRLRCLEENILKGLWKRGQLIEKPSLIVRIALHRLRKAGYLDKNYLLSADGRKKAALIVRLHRLWELYLTESLGYSLEKVHTAAEEMEHILTPEMEARLTLLLENPKVDPHQQPIPEKGI